jgi:hypothetical protein
MFDYVKCRAMSCPGCGGDLEWQTKSGPLMMSNVYVTEIMRATDEMAMIGGCADCGWVVEATIRRDKSLTVGQHLLLMDEKRGSHAPVFEEGEIQ